MHQHMGPLLLLARLLLIASVSGRVTIFSFCASIALNYTQGYRYYKLMLIIRRT
jgi:hypothetical protein